MKYKNFKIQDVQITWYRDGWEGDHEMRVIHVPTRTVITKIGKLKQEVMDAILKELDDKLFLQKEA